MKKTLIILSACVLLFGLAFWIGNLMVSNYKKTPHQGEGLLVAVEIPKGSGPKQISKLLEQKNVISDADTFYRYVRYIERKAGALKAGELAFRDNMTPREVLDILLEGTPVNYKVTIAEGLRIDEIGTILERANLADAKTFREEARDIDFVRSLGIHASSLEGFLYPDTYHFRKNTPVEDIISEMVASYKRVFSEAFKQKAQELGMTELEVVTLASIVEKETSVEEERHLIAGVFHNRLRKGMRLATDPTVIYAVLLKKGHFNGNLTRADLLMDHPYNTYRNPGLPPGPICNPGKEALQAVLHPKKTNYLFFVSKNDGSHHFCPNYACHEKAVRRFQGGS